MFERRHIFFFSPTALCSHPPRAACASLAGVDPSQIARILRDIALSLYNIHTSVGAGLVSLHGAAYDLRVRLLALSRSMGIIHGDVKPRNIVKMVCQMQYLLDGSAVCFSKRVPKAPTTLLYRQTECILTP